MTNPLKGPSGKVIRVEVLSPEARVELARLARAATSGPWQASGGRSPIQHESCHMVGPDGDGLAAIFYDKRTGLGFMDAKFIAAANPSTILSYEATVQALTVERDAERERVKALEAGPSREDVARIIEPHFDLSFDPDRGAVQNDIDRVANAALAKADAVLALLTPKDEPT